MYWKFDSSTNELYFKLKARANGWVGLGLSNKNYHMVDMDVVIAGVKNGQGYIGVRLMFFVCCARTLNIDFFH